VRYISASTLLFLFLCSPLLVLAQNATVVSPAVENLSVSDTSEQSPAIVVGFVGGFVRHDDAVHSPVQVALRLHSTFPSGVYVQVFENRRGEQAHQEILKLLDANHDGKLSDDKKRSARIIIYGMSWGGSQTVELARELDTDKIPVLLTIQVDSVAKWRHDDQLIPGNVAEAVNFYQPDGIIHGQQQIRAADAKRTRILGNFQFSYQALPAGCGNYPWWDRLFVKQHTSIECDPAVWHHVESLIRSKLESVGVKTAGQQ